MFWRDEQVLIPLFIRISVYIVRFLFADVNKDKSSPLFFPSIPTKTLLFSVLNFLFSAKDSTFLQFNQKKSKSVLTVG